MNTNNITAQVPQAKILVVDDDVRLRDLLRRYLTEQGFNVITAENATALNKLWIRERYDLLVLDLMLKDFCGDFGIGLTNIVMLGPDVEDFNHAMERFKAEDSRGDRVIFVLNEGVIRQGQTTEGAFTTIIKHPDFVAALKAGAQYILLRRLSCMHVLRERGIGFYDAAAGRPDRSGAKVPPTVQHMTKVWLGAFERSSEDIAEWLP